MNPFTVKYNADYFCDREEEIQQLTDNFSNGLNTLVHSLRRLGKTSLIKHLFYLYSKENEIDTLYVDLFATANMKDLIRKLSEEILSKYFRKNLFQGLAKILKGLRPTVSLAADGTPQLSIELKEHEYDTTLKGLFAYLESKNKRVLIAFDEFQEVANYEEKAEAILRTHIQPLNNILFIFSGSSNRILREMFHTANRPFYQSTEILILDKINRDRYRKFISSTFNQQGKMIEEDALEFVLDFTDNYTYYTQVICNMLFYRTDKSLSLQEATDHVSNYMENKKVDYYYLLSLLPLNQQKLAIAIAKEGRVLQPTAVEFIRKHNLPTVSSTLQAVKLLLKKEIFIKNLTGIEVYDVFFKRFLEKYY